MSEKYPAKKLKPLKSPRLKEERAQIEEIKQDILLLFDQGLVKTLTEAARRLKQSPTRVYAWAKNDELFKKQIAEVKEVLADAVEDELHKSKNIIAQIFLLKGYRPHIFRDNYRLTEVGEGIKDLLGELAELGREAKKPEIKDIIEGEFKELGEPTAT